MWVTILVSSCPFAEIGSASEHMEANKRLGKIVVTL
jgi:hypothetical protein